MHDCKGCGKSFEKAGSLNTHKRFCDRWRSLGLQVHKDCIPLEDRKKLPASCPLCSKEFDNIYSMSAHKGHCSGRNGTDHLAAGRGWNRGLTRENDERVRKAADRQAIPLSYIFDGHHPKAQTSGLRRRILREGILQNKCSICGIEEWMGRPIVCELDHANGNRYDHRLENLRLLCPNCHSQTDTYCGRNKGRYK